MFINLNSVFSLAIIPWNESFKEQLHRTIENAMLFEAPLEISKFDGYIGANQQALNLIADGAREFAFLDSEVCGAAFRILYKLEQKLNSTVQSYAYRVEALRSQGLPCEQELFDYNQSLTWTYIVRFNLANLSLVDGGAAPVTRAQALQELERLKLWIENIYHQSPDLFEPICGLPVPFETLLNTILRLDAH